MFAIEIRKMSVIFLVICILPLPQKGSMSNRQITKNDT